MVVLCWLTTTVYSREPASEPYKPLFKGADYVAAPAGAPFTVNYGAPAADYPLGAPAAANSREPDYTADVVAAFPDT